MSIRAVLFDLDGTLYDRDLLVGRIARKQFACFAADLAGIEEQQFVTRLLDLDAHGFGDKADLYRQMTTEWRLEPEIAGRLEQHFWDCYDGECTLSEDVFHTLCALRGDDKKLGVITNGTTRRQMCKLAALGLTWFFDVVLVSEAEALRKPDPRIFERALQRCNVTAADALFVGDYPDSDIAGARAAGLTAAWKRVPYWQMSFDDVLVVDRLSEILPLCLTP